MGTAKRPVKGYMGRYLEKTRGRILGPAEPVRLVSWVRTVGCTSSRHSPVVIPDRAKAFLALTDSRLLVVSKRVLPRRAEVLFEWPASRLRFSSTSRKVGGGLIHVVLPGGGRLDFEQVDGRPARDWTNLHFRRRN